MSEYDRALVSAQPICKETYDKDGSLLLQAPTIPCFIYHRTCENLRQFGVDLATVSLIEGGDWMKRNRGLTK